MLSENNGKARTILITGAGGFTGGHAIRYFSSLGMRVAVLVRGQPELSGERVDVYQCDLLDKEQVREAVKQAAPDYCLHLGGKNSVPESWKNPLLYLETNVMSTLYLLDALRTFPECRIVIAGSRLTFDSRLPYGAIHPYSMSKHLQETAALNWREVYGQRVIVAEPSNLIGPGPSTGFCSLLARHIVRSERSGSGGAAFRVSSPDTSRDFLDVLDAVRAYAILLQSGQPGKVYPVCSGKQTTLEEITQMMLRYSERPVSIEWGNDIEPPYQPPSKLDVLAQLGWKRQISLPESIARIIEYFRELKGEHR